MYDPEATRRAFDEDGFYMTGDIARQEVNLYFIEGRSAVDSKSPSSSLVVIDQKSAIGLIEMLIYVALKSGGYKISALDVEQEVLAHPKVSEAIVVGIDDEEYGQRIATAVVLHNVSLFLRVLIVHPVGNSS